MSVKKTLNNFLDLPSVRKILKLPMYILGCILSAFTIFFLWVISPFVKIKVAGLAGQRIGHLALNTDLVFRRRQLAPGANRCKTIFIVGRVANRQLLTMWKRHAVFIESRFLRGLFEYSIPMWKKTKFYEPLEMTSHEFEEFNYAQATLKLSQEEISRGEYELREMGIDPDKDWYVCIFARDSAYLQKEFGRQKDWSYHDYRNYDIDAFKLAIDHIVSLGGYVIRLGHHVEKPLNYEHPQVIDYASGLRTDFMDIFLVATCHFYIGGTSGISDIPIILDKPKLSVNTVPLSHIPYGKNNLYIPKKLVDIETKEYVPYIKYFEKLQRLGLVSELYSKFVIEEGWVYEENSPQEILDATVEMFARLENSYTSTSQDRELLRKYFNFFPTDLPASRNKNPIGHKFLREYAHLYFHENTLNAKQYEQV